MTAQARTPPPVGAERVILLLLGVVRGFNAKDRGYMSLVIDGRQHTPRCPFGQWITQKEPGQPKGDPCSERCEQAQQAVSEAVDWLLAHRVEEPEPKPRQLRLAEPASAAAAREARAG